MEDHDETGSEVHGFILLKKHTGDNAVYGMEKTVEEGAVIEKKVPELFINGKDTMAVRDINKFKGHRGSTIHGILFPQVGQKRLWQRKGTNFSLPQEGQPYMARQRKDRHN